MIYRDIAFLVKYYFNFFKTNVNLYKQNIISFRLINVPSALNLKSIDFKLPNLGSTQTFNLTCNLQTSAARLSKNKSKVCRFL